MFQSVQSSDPRVSNIVKALRCRKKTVYISQYSEGSTVNIGWDGGSRDEYYVVFANGSVERLNTVLDSDRFNDPYGHRHKMPPFPAGAVAVVRAGTFQGKPATPTIYFPKVA